MIVKWSGSSHSALGLTASCLAALVVGLVGCKEDRGLVSVGGTVTFEGGEMPGSGLITFLPTSVMEGLPSRPARAPFGKNGSFQANTYQPNDGLYPGTYAITVECWEFQPSMDGPPAKSYIHGRYRNAAQSGLEVKVDADARAVEYNIDVSPP